MALENSTEDNKFILQGNFRFHFWVKAGGECTDWCASKG